jgi:hypothetical protein
MAWASNRPTPVAEAVLPRRSRARAMTGAGLGGADRRQLDVEPAHPGVAEGRCLLGVAVDLPHRVIDIEEGQSLTAGVAQQGGDPGSEPTEQPRAGPVQLLDVAVGERTQERAQRRGGPDPGEHPDHPTVTQQVGVIVQSAPASIAATRLVVLSTTFALGTVTPASTVVIPAAPASSSTGSRPAADTRFGSSNTGRTL